MRGGLQNRLPAALEGFPHLSAAWDATHVVIPAMTRDQLREAAAGPLSGLGGIRFADGLLERMLQDTPSGPSGLPLLEYTLAQLWQQQERGELTAGAYHELGGVGGALARTADRLLWAWADAGEQQALERIFIQLVRPGEQVDAGERAPDTRRVADQDQFDTGEWALIQRLATTRLVVATRQPTATHTVELAHEALIQTWPRLAGWVEANRAFRSWQEGLRTALRGWRDSGRSPSRLLDTAQVKQAREWITRRQAEISADELAYVEASRRAAVRRRRARRTTVVAGVLVAALGLTAAGIALQQHHNSVLQTRAALSRQLVAEAAGLDATQPNLAKQLKIAAYLTAPTPEAFQALSTGLPLAGIIAVPGVSHVAISDRMLAVTAGSQVRL